MLQLLSAPFTFTSPASAHRYMVELASIELVLDDQGVPVPKDLKTINVVVSEQSLEAIETKIAETCWLKGWTMVSHWIPSDGCDCF